MFLRLLSNVAQLHIHSGVTLYEYIVQENYFNL